MAKKKSDTDDIRETVAEAPAKPYVVLARKYRPQTFDDLIGQEAMVQTLRNAFASGRIAHGYMLTGVRGVGKTTTARILARALELRNRRRSTSRPSTCPCSAATAPRSWRAAIPTSSRWTPPPTPASTTSARSSRARATSRCSARTKVFIIDEVHMLSKGAFNALLKTLEEPPGHVKFIFATTEIRKVPVTVLSRCQRFDLRRVGAVRLAEHLKSIVASEGASADRRSADDDRARGGGLRTRRAVHPRSGHRHLARHHGDAAGADGTVTATTIRAMLGLADRGRIFDLLG